MISKLFFFSFTFFILTTGLLHSQTQYDKEMISLSENTSQRVKDNKKLNVAVWFFHNTKGQKTELGDYIGRDFSIHFTNSSKGFNVLDRDHIEQLVSEQDLQAEGFINPATAIKVGNLTAADAIVTGTVDVGLHSLRIRIKIIDTSTGSQIAATIGNITIDENIRVILENTEFDKPIISTKTRVIKNESANDQRSTNINCQELKVGDYCFKNSTVYTYEIKIYGTKKGPLYSSNDIMQTKTLTPNENVCFFDLPEGSYDYQLIPTKGSYQMRKGQFRIEACQSTTYEIKN